MVRASTPIAKMHSFACRKHAAKLSEISIERIHDEIMKIIMAPEAAEVFMMMRDAKVLEVILPEATEIGRLRTASWLAKRGVVIDGLAPDPIRRLGAVLGSDAETGTVAQRLRLSNREADRLANMVALAPELSTVPSDADAMRLLHRHGAEAVSDAAIIAWAERLADLARIPAAGRAKRGVSCWKSHLRGSRKHCPSAARTFKP
jgi:poly(A) polymerase